MSDLTNALKQRLAWNKVDHCVRMGKSNYGWDASTVAGAKVEYAHTAPITALLISIAECANDYIVSGSQGAADNLEAAIDDLRKALA